MKTDITSMISITSAWAGFVHGSWQNSINVRDFIQKNYQPYTGDSSFLSHATDKTKQLFNTVQALFQEELNRGGIMHVNTAKVSTLISHNTGYIDKNLEEIVGLQGEEPLERGIMAYGGIRVVEASCEAYGYTLAPELANIFHTHRKSHNDGVFQVYDDAIKAARRSGIITGLPDGYGRGRIIGDYRRVALYGVDALIADKVEQRASCSTSHMDENDMRLMEEITDQIKALKDLKKMASFYGFDISNPATNAQEAIQWLYFAYLGAVKEQNGAAMSLGRTSTFLDIYIQRDIEAGLITEAQAQEYIDHFVMKLRMVRFLRTPDYNQLFSGDPVWVTESIGGMGMDGRTLVTRTSYRILQTLYNLGPAPEPNLTILWSSKLPEHFKTFCAQVSIDTSSIQYENDEIMLPMWGDDYGIACCVSAMKIGKQMQFFGARVNLAKALLYTINGGKDENTKVQVGPAYEPIRGDYLEYDEVMEKYDLMLDWLAQLYSTALNRIHYMHDKYCYETLEFALHDKDIYRTMAYGIAGLSVVADSLSAIKYAKVKIIRDEQGFAVDYVTTGDFPKFGNDDNRVDSIAQNLMHTFITKLRKHKTYRESDPTMSVLTITSNVVYGKKTGNTPDGRRAGEPFGPGANPMHGRDTNGSIASMASLAKLSYNDAKDGISYTWSAVPAALGREKIERVQNLSALLDGYFIKGGHHININVFDRETLQDAMEHPELYPQLTIRVSGYAVNFIKLTREQQIDVINRTFHQNL